jgi:hypothetical protein
MTRHLSTLCALALVAVQVGGARADTPLPGGCARGDEEVNGAYGASVIVYNDKGDPVSKWPLAKSGLKLPITGCNQQLNLVRILPAGAPAPIWVDRSEVKTNKGAMDDEVICTDTLLAQKTDTTQPASAGAGSKRCKAPPPRK